MRIILLVLTLLILFTGVSSVFATTVTISNIPASITEEPFNIDVSVSSAQAGTNYLRANLFPSGTKYFGYTFNGTSFVNSSDYSQYLPITIDQSGNWNGSIQAKLDPGSSYFSGPGSYKLKVRRYTQSGSSYTWSNEVALQIDFSNPTPTSTPQPTPTATPQQTPSPTSTPSSTSSSSKTKTTTSSSKTPSPTQNPSTPQPAYQETTVVTQATKSLPKAEYRIASVAAITNSPSPSPEIKIKSQKQTNLLVWAGTILIFAGSFLVGYIYLKRNANPHIKLRRRY